MTSRLVSQFSAMFVCVMGPVYAADFRLMGFPNLNSHIGTIKYFRLFTNLSAKCHSVAMRLSKVMNTGNDLFDEDYVVIIEQQEPNEDKKKLSKKNKLFIGCFCTGIAKLSWLIQYLYKNCFIGFILFLIILLAYFMVENCTDEISGK